MHRFGQRIRRDILRPQMEDYAHGTTGKEVDAAYLQDLRKRLESWEGSEIKETVERLGPEGMFEAIGASPEDLQMMMKMDPEGLERFKEARADMVRLYGKEGAGESEGLKR